MSITIDITAFTDSISDRYHLPSRVPNLLASFRNMKIGGEEKNYEITFFRAS